MPIRRHTFETVIQMKPILTLSHFLAFESNTL